MYFDQLSIRRFCRFFKKKSKFLKWYSRTAQSVWFLTKAWFCLISLPTSNRLIYGAVGRENMWHTCFSCIVESKTGSLGEQVIHPDQDVQKCVYGGWIMNSYLHDFTLLLFEIFETWAMSLYSFFFYACPWACFFSFSLFFNIAHSPCWIFLEGE